VSGATSATFVYDGDGNRVKEVSYENVAAGIRATSSSALNWPDVVTNGDTWADSGSGSSGEFAYTAQTGLQYVQLDLGAVYSVDKVRVWHYAADGRIYNATKTQVSADGSSWYTVFDSAVSGTYAETAEGRTYTFTARNVRYIRDYLNGSNKNAGNHWVEIEVWGTRTTAYVGAHYEKNVTANTTTSYYHAAGQRVAMRVSGSGAGVVYYLHGDHLGSASVTTDASGAKVGELRYYPYGGTRYIGGVTRTDRRFTGQIEDATIGLYFYNARYYDPALGRFVQADTIVPNPSDPQSLNRYSYCFGNPVKYTDPSGHAVEMDRNSRHGVVDDPLAEPPSPEKVAETVAFMAVGVPAATFGVPALGDIAVAGWAGAKALYWKAGEWYLRGKLAAQTGLLALLSKIGERELTDGDNDEVQALETAAERVSGETAHTIRGRQAHQAWDPGPGFEKEVTLPSGLRADAVNWTEQIVKEFKPNNARKIAEGWRQVRPYLNELSELQDWPKPYWTALVEVYDK
jgi:RHS repeat-associated protein